MTKLTYSTPAELIADFEAGAAFTIHGTSGSYPVTGLRYELDGDVAVYAAASLVPGNPWGGLKPDGSHPAIPGLRLEKTAPAPGLTGLTAHTVILDDLEPQPFLKSFVTGTPAYCPKTREVVDGIEFQQGRLLVFLANEDGAVRDSESYRHDGTHKHDPARSLVLGDLPPLPAPDVTIYVYANDLIGAVQVHRSFVGRVPHLRLLGSLQVPADELPS
ncbi:hypothetical protein [Xylophilus sp.]|uniref:hypothetical protein n=1 Tax=Xylophilus sp. TaxID=2653893 RepID=UPI0013BA1A47|nr:hypothetical protein [Xylophilus sp.]KAF1049353.1 MAG: hypothetical protein GAK38_00809 [Xylophilus sp.]